MEPLSFSIDQPANSTLLIDTYGFETELKVALVEPDVTASSVTYQIPYLRTVHFFSLVESTSTMRQLVIELWPIHKTNRSTVHVDVLALNSGNSAQEKRIRAFRLYSQAIESTDSEDSEVWEPRVANLRQAAELFDSLGMFEEKLQAELLTSHFTYFPLYRYREAIDIALRVEAQAKELGLTKIQLMAMQLRAQAMIERDDEDSVEETMVKSAQAQLLLDDVVDLATNLDMQFEAAWAINGKGIAYYYQDHFPAALEQYELALPRARALGDVYLLNLIRGNIALVQENTGLELEALYNLQEINGDLALTGEENAHINNLSEQGRIYKDLYRFPEAVNVLSDALSHAKKIDAIESSGRVKLSLAQAYHQMGYMDRAQALVTESIRDFKSSRFRRGLLESHRLSADINRYHENFPGMIADRKQQEKYLSSKADRADYLYSRALDTMATGSGSLETTKKYLEKSYKLAQSTGSASLQKILRMELCRQSLEQSNSGPVCNIKELQTDYKELSEGVIPRRSFPGMQIWAEILASLGRRDEAVEVLDQLVEKMRFYRQQLPGVLGAWYWEMRKPVFELYLKLVIDADIEKGDGSASILLLDRLRNFELDKSASLALEELEPAETERSSHIRSLLARLGRESDADQFELIERELDATLLKRRESIVTSDHVKDEAWLRNALQSLPANSMLLTYYFFDDEVYAWSARPSGVKLSRLDSSKDLAVNLKKARESFKIQGSGSQVENLSRLGDALWLPVNEPTVETVFLMPSGPINGFPFETLIVNGEFLADHHQVINVLSVNSIVKNLEGSLSPQKLFLAGNPIDLTHGQSELSATLPELEYIAKKFSTADLTLVQGSDLQLARFKEAAFNKADLIHIASHGTINLAYPQLSKIKLTGSTNTGEDNFLTPLDIEDQILESRLVVLSACDTTGLNTFGFDANLGFVTAFLGSGADAVVASLWPVSDRQTEEFMRDFYSSLADGSGYAEALSNAKRKRITLGDADAINLWAAFQLYRN